MVTIVNSVSVIKVKIVAYPTWIFFFFYTAWVHVTQMKLQRLTFVVIQNISMVDYFLCYEICEKV